MTRKQFEAEVEQLLVDAKDIRVRKGNDYASEDDVLTNFKLIATMTGLTPEQVWSVYVAKQFLALMTYAKRGHLEGEPIYQRVLDLHNYALLLWGIVRENPEGQN